MSELITYLLWFNDLIKVKEQPHVSYTVPYVGKLSPVNQLAAGGKWVGESERSAVIGQKGEVSRGE